MKSRSMRLSVILLVSLLLVGTLLLAACGGGSTTTTASSTQTSGTSTSQSTGSTDTSGTTATSAALTPKPGGTLRIAALSNGANIGWPATMTSGGVFVQSYYETLLRSDKKGNLIPWLAESYKVADDQKSITFTIRKGVKFSDGSDLTADVVKWNLEQYMTLAGGAAPAGSSRRRSSRRGSSRRGSRCLPPGRSSRQRSRRGSRRCSARWRLKGRGGRSVYRSGQHQRPGTTLSRPRSATPIRRSTWSPRRRMTRMGKSG